MIRKLYFLLAIPLVFLFIEGCVSISLHSLYETEIKASYKDSGQPAELLPVKVNYWYDSYGVFFDLRKPENVTAITDKDGKVFLNMADYSAGIDIIVGDNRFRIDKKAVLNGGHYEGMSYQGGIPGSYRVIEIEIKPKE